MAGKKSIMQGMTCHKLIMKSNKICDFCPATESFKSGNVSRRYHRSGDQLIQYISSPIKDDDGNVAGVIEIIRQLGEISEIKKQL